MDCWLKFMGLDGFSMVATEELFTPPLDADISPIEFFV
jgi:hypothetical protein